MNILIKAGEGLGFLVKGRESVYIITAASLIEEFPPIGSAHLPQELIFSSVTPRVGRLSPG